MRSLSIVLPCYNEAKSLPALVQKYLAAARRRKLTRDQFRLILVNNGSTDGTEAVLSRLCLEPGGEHLQVVTVSVNQGYGYGVYQGLIKAPAGLVGWSHADGQCDPEAAFVAWEHLALASGKTLVKGARRGRPLGPWLFSRGFDLSTWLILGRRLHEINAQPKLFDSELLAELGHSPPDFTFDLYVLLRALETGCKIEEISVTFPPRPYGESHWAATFRSRVRTIMRFYRFLFAYRLAPKLDLR